MTAERSEDYGPVAAHGFEEFVADNVVILRNALEGEKRRRTVEVLKMRGGAHLKGEHLFTLLPGTGMVVVPVAISAAPHYVSTERATSGNDVLDRMLGGGLFEKSLALVAGATGTGKSLLSAQFIHGGARRGERVLLHSFEEGRDQLIRNATNWARYTLRTAAMLERRPSGVLQVLNDALLQRGEAESFCSAVFARLRPGKDGASGELVVAGHPRPLLRRATGEVERLETGGALLGIMNGDVTLRVSLSLRRGDVLVLYTDGVTEARRDGELFGEDRLVEVVAGAGGSAEEVAGAIEAAVDGFGDHDRADDVAILAISPTDEVR